MTLFVTYPLPNITSTGRKTVEFSKLTNVFLQTAPWQGRFFKWCFNKPDQHQGPNVNGNCSYAFTWV